MTTVELTLYVGEDAQELLIAELTDLDFESFLQEDTFLKAYIPSPRWTDVKREHIERWLFAHGYTEPIVESSLEAKNWNRQWEETIRPLAVGPFLVKPTWADIPAEHRDKILVEIDPKMSFGTGYHESTRIALRFLPEVIRPGDTVLDAGAGTGILAVAALKLGAGRAVGFDNDEWAQENALENMYLNDVADRFDFRPGSLDAVPESPFDVILANINRNVLLAFMPEFRKKLSPDGRLVLAGLLVQDRPAMLAAAEPLGLSAAAEATEGEWWGAVFHAPVPCDQS